MSSLAWPLERNQIRKNVVNNAFGMVRNGGNRAHQGWDLYAPAGTPCYAIADGKVAIIECSRSYGNTVILEFSHAGRTLYAAYCHLSIISAFPGNFLKKGELIGLTGNTGNAISMKGEDQHLHFEIRTQSTGGTGLTDRIDPAVLYGRAPIGWTFYELHNDKVTLIGSGLKVPGINVREASK